MIKFICDNNLGKLARYLRILGFDSLYRKIKDNNWIIDSVLETNRILLTKDTKLFKQLSYCSNILLITENNPFDQIKLVKKKYGMEIIQENIFSRCLVCNTKLVNIDKDKVKTRVWPFVFQTHYNFMLCTKCDKIYWNGSHITRNKELLQLKQIL